MQSNQRWDQPQQATPQHTTQNDQQEKSHITYRRENSEQQQPLGERFVMRKCVIIHDRNASTDHTPTGPGSEGIGDSIIDEEHPPATRKGGLDCGLKNKQKENIYNTHQCKRGQLLRK